VRVATVVTSTDARAAAARAARGLAAHGLRPGDRLVLLVAASPDYLGVVLGALQMGVVPVPLDPALTRAERAPLVADADPALVVDSPALLAELAGTPAGTSRTPELAAMPRARPMHYTSGTTGRPKGVSSGLLDDADAAALLADERDFWGFCEADVHLVASPLHHSAPLRFSIATLLAGGRVVLPGRFDAAAWAAALVEHHATTAFVVPAHLTRLLATGLPDTAGVRLLLHAGAPCPPVLKQRTVDAFPPGSVWEFYGSTEGQFTACSTPQWQQRPTSVGQARPGRELSVDDEGRLWCAVPPFARFTYWRDPARTAAAWRGDCFTVGDLGRVDADGYVYLDGRRDDLVISGGVNVYPAEVEAALAGCPGVVEVAVFGVPDERWGRRVCAAVVGTADEAALRAWAQARLAPAKRPKAYVRVGDLPRTSTGKVRRLELPAAVGWDTTGGEP
jgi:acyl-CoA synthetase (AMP-forming)/AMP-acid ligase II